ncbi:MAG TPA: hypothetical protein DFS52_19205 [Myxococcales bacterium]|nr:hypothetical protein [Myxococcales bacterium]
MGPKAYLFRSELDRIAGFVAAYPRLETGGNLFGYRTNSGAPVVCIATGPGRAAEHHATAFYQDADYLETCGRLLFERFALQHVGEWHSHHRLGLQRPSAGDEATVFKCMEPMRWSSFMLGIANLDTRGKPSIGFFQLDASRRACTQLEVEVLDRASPLSLARALLPPGERSPNVAYGGGCEVRQPEHPWYERRGVSARLARELKGLAVLRDQAGYRFRLHPRGASLHLDLETPAGLAYRWVLESGFPERAPRILLGTSRVAVGWDASRLIAEHALELSRGAAVVAEENSQTEPGSRVLTMDEADGDESPEVAR